MSLTLRTLAPAVLLAGGAAFLVPAPAASQEIGESLGGLALDNARLYLRPVFEGLGYSLNSGFAEDASVHSRFGFDLGIRAMGAWVPEERKSFIPVRNVSFGGTSFTGDDAFLAEGGGSISTPTAVGPETGVTLVPAGGYRQALIDAGADPDDPRYALTMPDGFDIPAVPFVVIQAGLGIGFNTEVTARMIPATEASEDVGDVEALGFGAQHQISGWFPTSPVDVSLVAGYQDFQVGEYLDAKTSTYGVLVGRSFGPLDLYAVGRSVNPEVDVEYTVENPEGNPSLPPDDTQLSFSPPVESETRFGAGMNLRFLLLNLSGQYTFGEYDIASVKVGFSFR